MAAPQHTQLRRERRIGMATKDGQIGILARADEVEAWIPLKQPVKAEVQNTMESTLQMHMGAVRTPRQEDTMFGRALDGDRLPTDLGTIFTWAMEA